MTTVLSVASEIFPLIKTGGLADVAGALPGALAAHGVDIHSLVPGYPPVLAGLADAVAVASDADLFGGPARLLAGKAAGLNLFVLDAPHLYARGGNPYTMPDGTDWPDNPIRFAALAYMAALLARGAVPGFAPDIVHAHDWQAGLAPAYLHFAGGARPGTVMTVHNLVFQGWAPASTFGELRLPASAFAVEGVEYYGGVGMLKAGLYYADRLTTVSPTYAQEIRTPEYGAGLDGLLRNRADRLSGIVNGIDTKVWNPETDGALPEPFSLRNPRGRGASKAALQARLGLARDPQALVIGVVSRLTHQKGLDLLLGSLGALLESGAQLAMLGSGDPALQGGFVGAAADHPGRIGVVVGYSEDLAHLIQAGSDAVLVPSRFEPCGLTQLCALRYGALPVVSRVGGLADTVIDANEAARVAKVATGFQFAPATLDGLQAALRRVADAWTRPRDWAVMRRNAMRAEVGWQEPARAYAELYQELLQA
jgi:starch synthase